MSEIKSYTPGTFCWADLGTTDAAAAKKFYRTLFGWEHADVPAGPSVYTLFQIHGRDVGGLYQLDPKQQEGVPPHWMSYISVASADESAARAEKLGAKVLMPAFNVMNKGRMAVLQDPTGAHVSLWQPQSHIGAMLGAEPGTPCWNELMTTDVARARTFYTELFGWGTKEMAMGGPDPYVVFQQGDKSVAGMMATPAPQIPPHWMEYFQVADCDAQTAKAKSLGAAVLAGPMDVPTVGRFATLADPQGAAFSIIRFAY
jgi:hypothetical protein